MTQKIMFKKGDLVLYDKFGSHHETVSPSIFADDFSVGIILDIIEENDGGIENSYAEIVKEDGSKGFFFFILSQFIRTTIKNESKFYERFNESCVASRTI